MKNCDIFLSCSTFSLDKNILKKTFDSSSLDKHEKLNIDTILKDEQLCVDLHKFQILINKLLKENDLKEKSICFIPKFETVDQFKRFIDESKYPLYVINIDNDLTCQVLWEMGYAMGKDIHVIAFDGNKAKGVLLGKKGEKLSEISKLIDNLKVPRSEEITEFIRDIRFEIEKFEFHLAFPYKWEITSKDEWNLQLEPSKRMQNIP